MFSLKPPRHISTLPEAADLSGAASRQLRSLRECKIPKQICSDNFQRFNIDGE
jgi:hypothetical protein